MYTGGYFFRGHSVDTRSRCGIDIIDIASISRYYVISFFAV